MGISRCLISNELYNTYRFQVLSKILALNQARVMANRSEMKELRVGIWQVVDELIQKLSIKIFTLISSIWICECYHQVRERTGQNFNTPFSVVVPFNCTISLNFIGIKMLVILLASTKFGEGVLFHLCLKLLEVNFSLKISSSLSLIVRVVIQSLPFIFNFWCLSFRRFNGGLINIGGGSFFLCPPFIVVKFFQSSKNKKSTKVYCFEFDLIWCSIGSLLFQA